MKLHQHELQQITARRCEKLRDHIKHGSHDDTIREALDEVLEATRALCSATESLAVITKDKL